MEYRIKYNCLTGNYKLQYAWGMNLGGSVTNHWSTCYHSKTLFGLRKGFNPQYKSKYARRQENLETWKTFDNLFNFKPKD